MGEFFLRGKAWVCGDFVTFEMILPEAYWKGGSKGDLPSDFLGRHAMEGVDPAFAEKARQGVYAFVVAGLNFGGGGKSIEHPVLSLKEAGIKAVIAESFSRYFFRNAINNGLPVIVCKGIARAVETGNEIELDLAKGEVRNLTKGLSLRSSPLPEYFLEILKAGGYIPYIRDKHSW